MFSLRRSGGVDTFRQVLLKVCLRPMPGACAAAEISDIAGLGQMPLPRRCIGCRARSWQQCARRTSSRKDAEIAR